MQKQEWARITLWSIGFTEGEGGTQTGKEGRICEMGMGFYAHTG